MNHFEWHPKIPMDVIIFDCDGTLSQIEGIDYLAQLNGVQDKVIQLTEQAMAQTGIGIDLYEKRLAITKPTQTQLNSLSREYRYHLSQDVDAVIDLFHFLKKDVYVISAGIYQGVFDFAIQLGIPDKNIFAIDIYFDQEGNYLDFDRTSPLIHHKGKQVIIHKIAHNRRILHIGDGMNDVEVKPVVDRFIGYGGAVYREVIASLSDYYIAAKSLSAMLPYSLTHHEIQQLPAHFYHLYQKGLDCILGKSL